METIGFIGVGRIGTEICKHLLGAGYRVVGYRRSSLAEFEKIGGTAANSPAHVGDQCDLILSCLPGGNSLDDVVMAIVPALNSCIRNQKPSSMVAGSSTI